MTLCLAWRRGHEIYFASDSRLTDAENRVLTDDATKIFKVSVEIYGALPSNTPHAIEPLEYQTKFGMCFSGSYLNGSILADTMEEVLSNIQASPYSDISIENLSEIAFAIYKQVSRQLMQLNRERGAAEVLLGGYCFVTNEFKLYKFYPKPLLPGHEVEFEKQEIPLERQTIFLGDNMATAKAMSLLPNVSNKFSHFHLLREIIKDSNITTVGGNIQAGLFRPNTFKTYGIVEYGVYEDDYGMLSVKDNYKFRGLSLDFDDSQLRRGNLNIHKTFFNPFESERENFFKQVFDHIDKRFNSSSSGKE